MIGSYSHSKMQMLRRKKASNRHFIKFIAIGVLMTSLRLSRACLVKLFMVFNNTSL
jgi:hypothetical protein